MPSNGPVVIGFCREGARSIASVAAAPATRRCALIDPVLGFGRACGGTGARFAGRMAAPLAGFPGDEACASCRSIGRILALPPETRVFTGHGGQPGGCLPEPEANGVSRLQIPLNQFHQAAGMAKG
ncbi:hypothetical protein CR162_20785 [Pseudoroseomonas rhizosphaerae]|uniref:MBL fold metallo-hydrolase n=1 Tax=Teichococcus rhizosphaerae TaxID=1335062 RepID=A0A2C6ZYX4_9PROT|nr:hypothetical protein [Pseudoroseomonas rhizosphaerae]PHK93018.1 hypothetical protein CR162_20785 [Pseudoroseomonas rhizosphaerae]